MRRAATPGPTARRSVVAAGATHRPPTPEASVRSIGEAPSTRAKRRTGSQPPDRAGRRALGQVDGARGERDGQIVTDRRHVRHRNRRWFMGGLATAVLLIGVLFVAGAPWQTYRQQQTANAEADAELARIQAERADVKNQIQLLDTDEEIQRRARQFFGFVVPGDELYNFLPPATEPIGLPEGWPFTGVERELGVS